jgi:hypothetical protein
MDPIKNVKSINLGGFPPIFNITNDLKKKREFSKHIQSLDTNLLNIVKINFNDINKSAQI